MFGYPGCRGSMVQFHPPRLTRGSSVSRAAAFNSSTIIYSSALNLAGRFDSVIYLKQKNQSHIFYPLFVFGSELLDYPSKIKSRSDYLSEYVEL